MRLMYILSLVYGLPPQKANLSTRFLSSRFSFFPTRAHQLSSLFVKIRSYHTLYTIPSTHRLIPLIEIKREVTASAAAALSKVQYIKESLKLVRARAHAAAINTRGSVTSFPANARANNQAQSLVPRIKKGESHKQHLQQKCTRFELLSYMCVRASGVL